MSKAQAYRRMVKDIRKLFGASRTVLVKYSITIDGKKTTVTKKEKRDVC